MKKIGILGYGEIGNAIHKVYDASRDDYHVLVKDVVRDDGLIDIDVLNVAIPYNENFSFVDEVVKVTLQSSAKMVIIHSTVAVGTTRLIKEKLGPNFIVAHSPCRGVHPNLYEGIITFLKYVGSPIESDAKFVEEHLKNVGITTHVCKNSESSELAKLLDTSYYGLCIAYHGEAEKACEQFGAKFDDVMTTYNESYNEGYKRLGKNNVIRPVLVPPKGGIGGHCVIQNAELLKKQFDSIVLDVITTYSKKK